MSAPGPAIRLGILVPSSNSNAESITAQMLKHESDISVHYTRFPLPANPDEPFNVGMLGNAPALLRDAEVQAVALHGTVYAPTSSIDLSLTSVTETVVDRGVVVRHLVSTMTPAAGAPAMISVPGPSSITTAYSLSAWARALLSISTQNRSACGTSMWLHCH